MIKGWKTQIQSTGTSQTLPSIENTKCLGRETHRSDTTKEETSFGGLSTIQFPLVK